MLCLISGVDYSPSATSDLMREPTELLLPKAAVIALGSLAAAGISGWMQSVGWWVGRRARGGEVVRRGGGRAGMNTATLQASLTQLD